MKRIFSIILFTVILSVSVYAKEKKHDWKDYDGTCSYEYFIYNDAGLTQEQLAELAGISPQHCSGIETGAAKVSLPALVNLSNVLRVSMDELLMDSVLAASKPELMKEIEAVFSDASSDEMYLMLSQAKSIKEAVRIKNLLGDNKHGR